MAGGFVSCDTANSPYIPSGMPSNACGAMIRVSTQNYSPNVVVGTVKV